MRMPYGKYGPSRLHPQGVDLVFISSGYLRWLLKQDWFVMKDDELVLAVEKELRVRDLDNSHFFEDKVKV